jgi:hypothetical protein
MFDSFSAIEVKHLIILFGKGTDLALLEWHIFKRHFCGIQIQ